jgi:dienelactone hydrolase
MAIIMATGWERILEYAKMSENAYGDNFDVALWQKVDTAEHPNSGYGAVAYFNPETGEVVIAHRGTTGLDDGLQDAGMYLFNSTGEQGELALAFTNYIKQNFPNAKITHTGHSLGGSLANYMAKLDTASTAIAFDPLGTAGIKDFWDKLTTGKDKHDNILNLVSDPNVVNGAKPHAGKVIALGNKNPLVPHPTNSHSMAGYIIPLIEAKAATQRAAKQALATASNDTPKLAQPNAVNVCIPRHTCQANAPAPCQPNTPTAQELAEMVKTYRPRQN